MDLGAVTVRAVPEDDPEAVDLRRAMYADLAALYPTETAAAEERGGFAGIEARRAGTWRDVLVAGLDGRPVGHAGTRAAMVPGYRTGEVEEVRAVYVSPSARRSGVATALHAALVDRARGRGVQALVLETGVRQAAAIALYRRLGYRTADPFPPHEPDPTSVFLVVDL